MGYSDLLEKAPEKTPKRQRFPRKERRQWKYSSSAWISLVTVSGLLIYAA
jgi:hypothetical protein